MENSSKSEKILKRNDIFSNFWKNIFVEAKKNKISDIHILQEKNRIEIKVRKNGICHLLRTLNENETLRRAFIVRLKEIACLDVSKNTFCQDSSFSFDELQQRYRASLSPSIFGENIVLRVIDQSNVPNLLDLNFRNASIIQEIKKIISKREGFVCISGPTGSGKSTLMQAIINEIDTSEKKVISIENPVERIIEGVHQKEISIDVGWSDAIKSSLREDPDIILIGEIRDKESCKLAIEAAQTGHLVFSTIHANNTAGIVERLLTLEADPFALKESCLFLSAQRLAPLYCRSCSKNFEHLRLRGDGCEKCSKGILSREVLLEFFLGPKPEAFLNFDKNNFQKKYVNFQIKEDDINGRFI